mgnify:CR=1 FL=1
MEGGKRSPEQQPSTDALRLKAARQAKKDAAAERQPTSRLKKSEEARQAQLAADADAAALAAAGPVPQEPKQPVGTAL